MEQRDRCNCALCERSIYPHSSAVREFRGLYRSDDYDHLILTNAGIVRADRTFTTTVGEQGHATEVQLGPMARAVQDSGMSVLVFHESCWKLLKAASHTNPPNLERLYHVCNSYPPLFYGHGQHMGQHHHNKLPRNYSVTLRDDPYEVPFIRSLIAESSPELEKAMEDWDKTRPWYKKKHQPANASNAAGPSRIPPRAAQSQVAASHAPAPAGRNLLDELSPELCAVIANHLPTKDFLTARLASRAFTPIFNSQQFWASRFRHGFEHAYVFEARHLPKDHDFRWLYHRVKRCSQNQRMIDRCNIWTRISMIADLMDVPFIKPPEEHFNAEQTTRMETATPSQPVTGGPPTFTNNKLGFYRHDAIIPQDLSQLTVHLLDYSHLMRASHICGITMTPATGNPTRMGFLSPNSQTIDVSQPIWGFAVAIGPNGMHAIRCVFDGGQTGPWLGDPTLVPHTERLVFSGPISNITAFFDGCKLYALCAGPDVSAPVEPKTGGFQARGKGLWFPDVPRSTLNINEATFLHSESMSVGFHITNHASFSGPDGIFLQHLTGIAAFCNQGVHRLQFYYDRPSCARPGSNILGWHRSPEEQRNGFKIDGPGGELVTAVDVYMYNGPSRSGITKSPMSPLPLEHLWGLKLHTNHGRSGFLYGEESWYEDQNVKIITTKPEGETITGFYAMEGASGNFKAIGVISEAIDIKLTV